MKRKHDLPLRKKIIFLLIIILFPFLCLFVTEIFLSLFFPQPPRGFSSHLFTSKNGLTLMKVGVRGTQYSREFNVILEGNAFGYRKGTWSKDLSLRSDREKCIIIGDSFAFGWGVEASEVFSNLLDKKYMYMDLGIPGDGPSEELKRLTCMLDNSGEVKEVILLFYDNDFSDFKPCSESATAVVEKVPFISRIKALLLKLNSTRLFASCIDKIGLSDYFASLTGYDKLFQLIFEKDIAVHKDDFYQTAKWHEIREKLNGIKNLCKHRKIRLNVVRVMPRYFFSEDVRNRYIQKYQLKKDDYNFNVMDERLSRIFKHYYIFVPESLDSYYKYDMHLNAKGHLELSKFINTIISTENPSNNYRTITLP